MTWSGLANGRLAYTTQRFFYYESIDKIVGLFLANLMLEVTEGFVQKVMIMSDWISPNPPAIDDPLSFTKKKTHIPNKETFRIFDQLIDQIHE